MAAVAGAQENAFVEYLDVEFVDDVSEFQCVRCERVLFQHYISNCGHAFCANCKQILDDGSHRWKCPRCQLYISNIDIQNLEFDVKLKQLRAHCPNKKYGCEFVDQLKEIHNHLKLCEFTRDNCLAKLIEEDGNNYSNLEQTLIINQRFIKFNEEIRGLRDKINAMDNKDSGNEVKYNGTADKINELLEEKLTKTIFDLRIEMKEEFEAKVNERCSMLSNEVTCLQRKLNEQSNEIEDLKLKVVEQESKMENMEAEFATNIEKVIKGIKGNEILKNSINEIIFNIIDKKVIGDVIKKCENVVKQKHEECWESITRSMSDIKLELAEHKDEIDGHSRAKISLRKLPSENTFSELETLSPSNAGKTFNILLVGPKGVGKSTFINAFCNYLKFDSLEEAIRGKTEILIATKSSKDDEDEEKEHLETQVCKDYVFRLGNFNLRFIDAPAIEDTETEIMQILTEYKELHAICLLLKQIESSNDLLWTKRFLNTLHSDAKDSIFYIFTHSESFLDKEGSMKEAMERMLQEIKEISPNNIIPFSEENVFCVDNAAFPFLTNPRKIIFNQTDFQNFSSCWIKSVSEVKRMIERIVEGGEEGQSLTPHIVRDSLCVIECRKAFGEMLTLFSKIKSNTKKYCEALRKVEMSINQGKINKDELGKDLFKTQLVVDVKEVSRPRTVCTGDKCRQPCKYGPLDTYHYPKPCHDPCDCEIWVEKNVVGDEGLRGCCMSYFMGNCNVCGCSYKKHQHIYYTSETEETKVLNEEVEKSLNEIDKVLGQLIERAEKLENVIASYENLESESVKNIAKLAGFLKHNAMITTKDYQDLHLDELASIIAKLNDDDEEMDVLIEALNSSDGDYSMDSEEFERIVWEVINYKIN